MIWTILLCSAKALSPLVLRTFLCFAEPLRSKLRRLACASTDSLALAYLRPRSLCERDARGTNLSFQSKKRKMLNTRMGIEHLWRRRRDLDSRAGKTRPTPLAGAPLRPLEYFSVTGRRLVTCRIIIPIILSFVNTFS